MLFEAYRESFHTIYEDFLRNLEKCKPFLNELKKMKNIKFLYSGRSVRIKNFEIRNVRKNRLPLDTPREIHYVLDDLFYKKFKVKARSQSIFATSNIKQAQEYGTPYIILPIGNYKIIWSKKYEDLWGEFENNIELEQYFYREVPLFLIDMWADEWSVEYDNNGLKDYGVWKFEGEEYEGHFDDVVEQILDNEYDDTDENYNERSKRRYEIQNNLEFVPEIEEEEFIEKNIEHWKDNVNDVRKELINNYQEGDLLNAIKYKHEIMIVCDKIMIVDLTFEETLKKYIRGEIQNQYKLPGI